jgi:hypothetical protein
VDVSIARVLASPHELGYTLVKYNYSTVIYFEDLGLVSLYNTEWKTMVYVNFKQIFNQSDLMEEYIWKINEMSRDGHENLEGT